MSAERADLNCDNMVDIDTQSEVNQSADKHDQTTCMGVMIPADDHSQHNTGLTVCTALHSDGTLSPSSDDQAVKQSFDESETKTSDEPIVAPDTDMTRVQPSIRSYPSLRSLFARSPPASFSTLPPLPVTANGNLNGTATDGQSSISSVHLETLDSTTPASAIKLLSIKPQMPPYISKSVSSTPKTVWSFLSTSVAPTRHQQLNNIAAQQ